MCTVVADAQKYSPVDKDSKVEFTIKNFGINTKGSFTGLKGDIVFDEKNVAASSFNVSVDATTIDTDNNMRDGHLKKDDYFDVDKYPTLQFTSSSFKKTDDNSYSVTGNLTIKATTKPVTIPFSATLSNGKLELKGSVKIQRKDYKVGGSSAVLSDDVTINLDVVAAKA